MRDVMPSLTQIETTTCCVGECSFCPHAAVTQGRPVLMPMDTFVRVLQRIKEARSFETVYLFGNGDPFCDVRLPQLVQLVPQKLRVVLYTTLGMRLTHEMRMVAARCSVILSAAELSAERQRVRAENMQQVVVSAVHAIEPMKPLGQMLAKEIGAPLWVFPKYNWLGKVDAPGAVPQGRCRRPLHDMYVLTDGTVTLCCMDGAGEHARGNLLNESVAEIWAKATTQQYGTELRATLPGCSVCTCSGESV